MAATSIDKLAESFENPKISPTDSDPMYAIIHSLQKLLNSNVASVSTNIRYGTLGHLCLTISSTVYSTLSTTLFIPPPNTRVAPVVPAGATVNEA